MIKSSLFAIIILICFSGTSQIRTGIYSPLDFGAKADGITPDTRAIQSAIDKAANEGGGVVVFPAGKYLSGSVILKDFVVLRFEPGATLLGSLNRNDYPESLGRIEMIEGVFFAGPLIYAENAQNIGIEGSGMIDGRGTRDNFEPLPPENLRPGLLRFLNCRFVSIRDVSLVNSARWTLHLRECEDVSVSNIYLNSNVNRNNDGIDVDGCRRVRITGCHINSEDDAIVLKSYKQDTVQDIVVDGCILSSKCSAFKIGTETIGTFRNISVSNCVIYGSRGIDLFTVDGADINSVTISNVVLRDCKSAIQLRLGGRLKPYNVPPELRPKQAGTLRNVIISNIQAINVEESQDFISGIPGHNIENITLENINITYKGGGTPDQAQREIPEEITKYPKIGMFGDLPSFGFFIRHVDGISLRNVNLTVDGRESRPAIVCDNVKDLRISGSTFSGGENAETVIRLNQVNSAVLNENQTKNPVETFVRIQNNSGNIHLIGNNLKNAAKLFGKDETIRSGEIRELNNYK